MSVTLFDMDDVNVIRKLHDKPNIDDSLTATDMKTKFDTAGINIGTYLNNTIVPAIDSKLDIPSAITGILKSNAGTLSQAVSGTDYASATHTHTYGDLSGVAAATHSHVKTDVTDFAHTHTISEVTDLTEEKVRRIYYGTEVPASHTFPDGYVPADGDIYIQYTAPVVES